MTTTTQREDAAPTPPGPLRTAVLLAAREVRTVLKTPAALVPSLAIPVFIYLVTMAMFEGYAAEFGITDWEAFMIPVAILFAVANGSAGQNLVADIERGYFDKLLTTPASRLALVLGAMGGDLFRITAQSVLALSVGLLVAGGLATGLPGAIALIALGTYWGLAYTAIGFAVALKTGNAQATESTFLLFFPLMFLSPAFAPREAMAGCRCAGDSPTSTDTPPFRSPRATTAGAPSTSTGAASPRSNVTRSTSTPSASRGERPGTTSTSSPPARTACGSTPTGSRSCSANAKAAGLPPIRMHDLRHTHATLLLQAGVHPKIVSERLWHHSVAFTLDTYAHVLPGMQAEAAEDLADRIFQASEEDDEPEEDDGEAEGGSLVPDDAP